MTVEDWRQALLARIDKVEVSINDLKTHLLSVESDTKTRLVAVETKNAIDEIHRQNVEKRLTGIEDSLKWLVRLILGALIVAIVAFATSGGLII